MGIFRAINRRVEDDYVYGQIYPQLNLLVPSTQSPALQLQVAGVDCHLGRGGRHIAFFVDYGTDQVPAQAAFHLCRTKGYVRNVDGGEWVETEWFYMAPSPQLIASRIVAYCLELRNMLTTVEDVVFSSAHNDEETSNVTEASNAVEQISFYDEMVEVFESTNLKMFKPYVGVNVGGTAPSQVICFQMLGENPEYLLISKKNQIRGIDGRWSAWWFSEDKAGEVTIEELEWTLNIPKALSLEERAVRLYVALAELMADINGITIEEIIGENVREVVEFPLAIIYTSVIEAMEVRDFCGRHLSTTKTIEGVADSPSITFALPTEGLNVVAIHRKVAREWTATILHVDENNKVFPKKIPWKFEHIEDENELADEFVLLAHRLAYGDLRNLVV